MTTPTPHAEELAALLERAARALKPFADCVYNDNFDITITKRVPTTDELQLAFHCRRAILTALHGREG